MLNVSAARLLLRRRCCCAQRRTLRVGRWQSDTSLRRYEKGGRLGEQLWNLPEVLRSQCSGAIARLREKLCE